MKEEELILGGEKETGYWVKRRRMDTGWREGEWKLGREKENGYGVERRRM